VNKSSVTVPKRIPYSSNHAIKENRGHIKQARHMQLEATQAVQNQTGDTGQRDQQEIQDGK